jgi:hypothetical protein
VDRRAFLATVDGIGLAPRVGEAQPTRRMARIAMLRSSPQDLPDREPIASSLAALRAGLRDQGYVDGVDYTIDYRVPRGGRRYRGAGGRALPGTSR